MAHIETHFTRTIRFPRGLLREVLIPPDNGSPGPDYTVVRKIGEGGMGVVFEAEQRSLNRRVAIKTLLPSHTADSDAKSDFLKEALLMAQLDHPNIVPVYELGRDPRGIAFLAMKLVKGRAWHDLLYPPRGDKDCIQIAEWMSLVDHIEILIGVCRAVGFAHARRMIHRDIKPRNVMVGEFGEVYLMDWGLATPVFTADDMPEGPPHRPGLVAGSPNYMPPEMVRGDAEFVDVRSDVYLLGAVLHELLYGNPPHPGGDLMAVLVDAVQNRISTPKKGRGGEPVPEMLRRTCFKALSTEPEDRHADVASFQHELRNYLRSPGS